MTLRFKLNLILALLLIITNGTVAYLLLDKQKTLLSDSITQQANSVTTLVSQDLLKLLLLDSPDAASDIIQKIQSVEDLARIELFDKQDKNVLNFISPQHDNEAQNSLIPKDVPVTFSGEQFGHFKLYFSKNLINNHLTELNIFLAELFFTILFLTILFALFVDRYFTQRLTKLNQALLDTATTSDFSIRLPVTSNDELGQAYQHFNDLVSNTDTLTTALQKQVIHDSLTNLHNRFYISQQLLERFAREPFYEDKVYALCYFDLDQFKTINDTYGHSIGDQFLKSLANKLSQVQNTVLNGKRSCLARLGGDEFSLLIEDTDSEEVRIVLRHFQQAIQAFEYNYSGHALKVNVSIGSILFDNKFVDNETLLSAADTACNQSKSKGRGRITTHWIDSEELASEKDILNWFHRIQTALKQQDFVVFLQPIQPSKSYPNQACSYEALIRLKEGDSILSPFHFIEPAERFNLIPEIDFYMVDKVTQHLKQNPEFLKQTKHVAINLSGVTLSSMRSAQQIINIVEASGVPFNKLCFEVTETSALSNFNKTIDFIKTLRERGSRFSLDDFGTGMSSFDYLYKLPVNYLKIDGSFITDIISDPVKREMVIAMQKIAVLMKLETVAEFVENQEIVEELDRIGIHYHQGYHYSAPKAFETFVELPEKPSDSTSHN